MLHTNVFKTSLTKIKTIWLLPNIGPNVTALKTIYALHI